ncbi:bifunctional phosphopantothenoylcysteine decarboxylase/phosphopantothenate--cysteine ligase CoaBC [Candidatus Bathyarchaeota archaeon]|nr:bifunctional phosphopantothenoylcysteine decarboxylase/phosphopantothenate--cysteine ligase CoaBC [Candidatus Bathyarchaeota archaeon]
MSFGEHTSKLIIGSKSSVLRGRRIILCVTGSVAAVKSPEIARELMRLGSEVFAVMTPMAQEIIHPYMLEWATGNPVVTKLTGQIEHVTYAGEHEGRADLILVAPCTANTIGKVASGIDDTPVTTTLTTGIGAGIPVIIAPAMHASMYNHPIVIENINKLEKIGIKVLMPRVEEGKAKIPDTNEIVKAVVDRLTLERSLEGMRVLVTAGPTREYIDAFRFVSNPSSGKMGVAVAEEALKQGAEVTLIYGPGSAKPPAGVRVINVESTEEMLESTIKVLKEKKHDVAILTAAASDFGPIKRDMVKTPSSQGTWILKLKTLPKIVEQIKKVDPEIILVGFKAEYNVPKETLIERSYSRLKETGMDFIIANDVSKKGVGFGTDTNEVYIIDAEKNVTHLPLTDKKEIAKKLISMISKCAK